VSVIHPLRAGVRLLTARSSSILPVYLLATGLYGIARTPVIVAGMLTVWIIDQNGQLGTLIDTITQAREGNAAGGDPMIVTQAVRETLNSIITPTIGLIIASGVILALGVLVASSAINAGLTIGAIIGVLNDNNGIESGLKSAQQHWRAMLVARLLFAVSIIGILGLLAVIRVGIGSVITTNGAAAQAVSTLITVVFGLVGVVGMIVIWVLFAFVEQAVVIDEHGGIAGVRQSARLPIHRPRLLAGYVAIATGVIILSIIVGRIAALGGAGRVISLITLIIAPAIIDGFKTSAYTQQTLTEKPPTSLQQGHLWTRTRIWTRKTIIPSVRAVMRFIQEHPLANMGSAACLLIGGVIGWQKTINIPTTISIDNIGAGFGTFPVGVFVNLAVNNWLVAAGVSYGGIAVGVPAIVGLVFNGLIIGAVGGAIPQEIFIASVAPHGIIEIPAIIIGGGVGLWLGGVLIRAIRGNVTTESGADRIYRAYQILLGLIPFFILAAFIEAFVTASVAELLVGMVVIAS
jgi:uncharacterized membrane protein SpoIIM required for sporulation